MKGLSDRFFTIIVVFILAFGMGFFANDYLRSSAPEIVPEKIVLPVNGNFTSRRAEIKVVAVTENGEGLIGRANIELVPGKARVLVNTNPFIEADAQQSAEMAVSYAINYTGIGLKEHDIIVSFNMSDESGNYSIGSDSIVLKNQVVGGPSAGAALSVATIAVLKDQKIRDDVAITGTVELDGNVGQVGGVMEKADGLKIFLVPEGQEELTYYEKELTTETRGRFQIKKVRYVPKTLSLNNYTMSEWNMTTYEIAKVEDALAYVLE